jgi:hypothetical protein
VRLEALLPRRRGAPPAGRLAEAVPLRRQHLQELPPAREQRVELPLCLVRQRAHLRADALGEEREHAGVAPVGLRQLARRARELAHLARVRDDHRQPGRGERGDGRQLVAAGGLQHD